MNMNSKQSVGREEYRSLGKGDLNTAAALASQRAQTVGGDATGQTADHCLCHPALPSSPPRIAGPARHRRRSAETVSGQGQPSHRDSAICRRSIRR